MKQDLIKRCLLILIVYLVFSASTALAFLNNMFVGSQTKPSAPPPPPATGPPSPPTQAAAANLTTCVLCIDWTAPTGGIWTSDGAGGAASQPAGVNAAQTNTYIDCAMTSGQSSALLFFLGTSGPTSTFPCPSITTDGSTPVLQQLIVGTPPSGSHFNTLVGYCGAFCSQGNTGWGWLAPTAMYFEATFKVPVAATNCWVQTIWSGGWGEIPDSVHNFLEFDAWEMGTSTACLTDAGAQSSNVHLWGDVTPGTGTGGSGGGGICCFPSNWSGSFPPTGNPHVESNYVKLGERITTDGTTVYKCMWVNDVEQNCQNSSSMHAWQLTDAHSRQELIISVVGGTDFTGPMTGYIKSFNVWACGNWKTIACRTSSANPGGY